MGKVNVTRHHRAEKAIIDALLKISEIIQKTETNRQLRHVNKSVKNTVGDGDYHERSNDEQRVPMPPAMRTLESYVSEFRQPCNCNQASKECSMGCVQGAQNSNHSFGKLEYEDDRSCKRYYSDTSYSEHEEQSTKRRLSYSSFQSDGSSQPLCEELKTIDNQPTITSVNSSTVPNQVKSMATSSADDQLSRSLAIPVVSGTVEQQLICSANSKENENQSIDQHLQETLEKHLRDCLLSSPTRTLSQEHIPEERRTKSITLTKSETENVMNRIHCTQQTSSLEHYEKQRQSALLAVEQGNYSLSYSIYSNLLHDYRENYKLKSEILASRAMSLLLEQKCFESIEDCTRAIVFNQWNKLAYVVRAACWMIKHEYVKAVEDYSKLFHVFDQSQYVLDLLNLAFRKLKTSKNDGNGLKTIEPEKKIVSSIADENVSLCLASPTASFIQPAVYLCYPYQTYPSCYAKNGKESSYGINQ
ncbi:unnamed protein product [Adineta ricciae]|nr:unnamed protein product [Adineta ricciae]